MKTNILALNEAGHYIEHVRQQVLLIPQQNTKTSIMDYVSLKFANFKEKIILIVEPRGSYSRIDSFYKEILRKLNLSDHKLIFFPK